jgi:hypothetical protein
VTVHQFGAFLATSFRLGAQVLWRLWSGALVMVATLALAGDAIAVSFRHWSLWEFAFLCSCIVLFVLLCGGYQAWTSAETRLTELQTAAAAPHARERVGIHASGRSRVTFGTARIANQDRSIAADGESSVGGGDLTII